MPASNSTTVGCSRFTDFLIRRTPHYDKDIIRDVRPRDGYIGHFNTAKWDGPGVERIQDRIHTAFPDMGQCWQDVPVGSCVGTPCDPPETRIGFGYSRDTYRRQRTSYATDILCFDSINTADAAVEQFRELLVGLRRATNYIISDRVKTEALRLAGTKLVANSTLTPLTYTLSDDCMILTPNALPDSKITMQMLMRQIEPLKLNGYFGEQPSEMAMLAEYVTDVINGYELVQGNAALTTYFRFTDFEEGGKLYKYGLANAVGNFGLRYDPFPIRYQELQDGTLQRVFPYTNVSATAGIKNEVNQAYVNAPYQIDFIWHRMALTILTATMESVNPMMPFARRDLAGKWQFVMDNLGVDPATGCVVDNKRRNKGQFIADFDMASRMDHPEWITAILTRREPACIVTSAPCSDVPAYVEQDYSSANDLCDAPQICFDLSDVSAPFQITDEDGTITCNGVPVSHDASGSLANLAAVADWLNTNAGQLGTWSVDGSSVCLDGSTCSTVNVVVTQFGV